MRIKSYLAHGIDENLSLRTIFSLRDPFHKSNGLSTCSWLRACVSDSEKLDLWKLACKTRENSNFLKKGKMVISVKILTRSQMIKQTSPLESSSKSSYHVEFYRIPRQLKFSHFSR